MFSAARRVFSCSMRTRSVTSRNIVRVYLPPGSGFAQISIQTGLPSSLRRSSTTTPLVSMPRCCNENCARAARWASGRSGTSVNGPLTFWMYPVFGLHGASYFLGVSEWLTAALLIWGFWNPKAGILGAILSVGTFVTTVSIIPFMPDGWNAAAGFPAMQGNVAFLMKDVVFLAVSVYLLKQDVARVVDSRDAGAAHAGDRRAVEAVP